MPQQPDPSRALIVRVRNWVGDVVLGLPALELLAQHGFALHIVARGGWAPALLAGYPWPVTVQQGGLHDKVRQLHQLRKVCRARDPGFDARENALLLPVSISSALEMRLAGLRAVGVAKEGRSFLLHRAEPWARSGHELQRYWDLACRFLNVQAAPPAEIGMRVAAGQAESARQLLAANQIHGDFVLICPFAGGRAATADKADKRWPGFADFVQQGARRLGLPLVVCPGPGEMAEARQSYASAHILEGVDLSLYVALLQQAALVVANDTGPGHVAAALGRPVLSVLGATEAARWGPWGRQVQVLQVAQTPNEQLWPSAEAGLLHALKMLQARGPAS